MMSIQLFLHISFKYLKQMSIFQWYQNIFWLNKKNKFNKINNCLIMILSRFNRNSQFIFKNQINECSFNLKSYFSLSLKILRRNFRLNSWEITLAISWRISSISKRRIAIMCHSQIHKKLNFSLRAINTILYLELMIVIQQKFLKASLESRDFLKKNSFFNNMSPHRILFLQWNNISKTILLTQMLYLRNLKMNLMKWGIDILYSNLKFTKNTSSICNKLFRNNMKSVDQKANTLRSTSMKKRHKWKSSLIND